MVVRSPSVTLILSLLMVSKLAACVLAMWTVLCPRSVLSPNRDLSFARLGRDYFYDPQDLDLIGLGVVNLRQRISGKIEKHP